MWLCLSKQNSNQQKPTLQAYGIALIDINTNQMNIQYNLQFSTICSVMILSIIYMFFIPIHSYFFGAPHCNNHTLTQLQHHAFIVFNILPILLIMSVDQMIDNWRHYCWLEFLKQITITCTFYLFSQFICSCKNLFHLILDSWYC